MNINKQKTVSTKKRIDTIFSTDIGTFLLKSIRFEDDTIQSRLHKISFDAIGEMYSENSYGCIFEDSITDKKSLLSVHDKAFFILKEQFYDIINNPKY